MNFWRLARFSLYSKHLSDVLQFFKNKQNSERHGAGHAKGNKTGLDWNNHGFRFNTERNVIYILVESYRAIVYKVIEQCPSIGILTEVCPLTTDVGPDIEKPGL